MNARTTAKATETSKASVPQLMPTTTQPDQETYGAKYPKAVEKLLKDREVLLSHFDFPAEHWIHLRSTNAIESTFATVRLCTKNQGCRQPSGWTGHGLQTSRCRPGPLALRQRTPPGRARSRWRHLRGRAQSRARRPEERRVIKPANPQLLTIPPSDRP